MAYTVFLSSGYSPAMLRIPSVPKSFLKSAPAISFYHRGHRQHRDASEFLSAPPWLIAFSRFHFGSEPASRHLRGNFRANRKLRNIFDQSASFIEDKRVTALQDF